MIRIGIIGSENSHALAFSRLVNLPDPETGVMLYPDLRVVGVYGEDRGASEAIQKETGVDFVAENPKDFMGRVDAMMVTSRKGSLHYNYAMPFIEKGMPMFIDKPFTSDLKQAELLAAAAQKHGAKLCGGSGCKYAYDIRMLRNRVGELIKSQSMISAAMNFAADPASEYDGFFFYSSHLTEMALAAFGSDVKSVKAFDNAGSRVCVWRYDAYDISLHYTKGSRESSAVLFTKDGNIYRQIDISLISRHEMDVFAKMLRSGEMEESYESFVLPVRIISAIEESVANNTEVLISR